MAVRAAVELPIIVDADTGFGNALNVGHAVRVLDATGGNYTVVFFACASVYMVATAIIHFLLPRNRSSVVAGGAETAAAG